MICLIKKLTLLGMARFLWIVLAVVCSVNGQHNLNQWPGRSVIANLFEWRFKEIAHECEHYLGPNGYGAVQVGYIFYNMFYHLVTLLCE